MTDSDFDLESGAPGTSPPPIGLVAEGLHGVVRAATESDDTFALVEATFDEAMDTDMDAEPMTDEAGESDDVSEG